MMLLAPRLHRSISTVMREYHQAYIADAQQHPKTEQQMLSCILLFFQQYLAAADKVSPWDLQSLTASSECRYRISAELHDHQDIERLDRLYVFDRENHQLFKVWRTRDIRTSISKPGIILR